MSDTNTNTNTNLSSTRSDYEILLEELNLCGEKWKQRLSYHVQNNDGADIHDCYLCTTIMYEIERVIQETNNKIAAQNRNKIFNENYKNFINSNETFNHYHKTSLDYSREKYNSDNNSNNK